jgi:hypothetical protein
MISVNSSQYFLVSIVQHHHWNTYHDPPLQVIPCTQNQKLAISSLIVYFYVNFYHHKLAMPHICVTHYLIWLQQFVVCCWWHTMHSKQYAVYASNPHYFVNYIIYVKYYSKVNPVFDYVCCFIAVAFWLGFQRCLFGVLVRTLLYSVPEPWMRRYYLMICICNFFLQISPFCHLLSSTC